MYETFYSCLTTITSQPRSLTEKQKIGEGGFGTIYETTLDNNIPVIIKCINKNVYSNEISMLKKVKNVPNVIQYIKHYSHKNKIYIVMNKIPNVIDLFFYISEKKFLSEETSKIIFKQLITILLNCKNKNILHNDIKDENILINPNNLEITLIDFGSAQIWNDNYKYTHYTGTIVYCCPEFFITGLYTANGITVWSLGILLYNMLYGNIPFHSIYEIKKKYFNIPDQPEISNLCKSLLYQCLSKNETSRIPLEQIKHHPWLQ